MTRAQAIETSRRLWGERGAVDYRCKAKVCRKTGRVLLGRFRVGVQLTGGFFEVRGHGNTWDDAFADAATSHLKFRS
jgi:hypothetical protein